MRDTAPEAARVQADVHRRMGSAERVRIACEMSDEVRAVARAGIRARHPELDDEAVEDRLLWELYGFRHQR